MISFFSWLKRGFVGTPEMTEEGQVICELHRKRFHFFAVRRVYKKNQGWFRKSQVRLGLPTVTVGLNICDWETEEFIFRCLHPDSPDLVTLQHGFEPFRWKCTTPLRNKADAKIVHDFLVELEQKMSSNLWCDFESGLQEDELALMKKVDHLLEEQLC